MNKVIIVVFSFLILSLKSYSQPHSAGCCYDFQLTQSGFATFNPPAGLALSYTATICPGLPFNLSAACHRCSDCGSPFGNYATNYIWDYGDASPVTVGQNATHSYANTGVYNITLTATGFNPEHQAQCQTTLAIKVIVSNESCPACCDRTTMLTGQGFKEFFYKSKNDFYFGFICPGKPGTFKVNCPGATNYSWDFGDGNTVSGPNLGTINHAYANAGTYQGFLIVTGPSCYTKINFIITVSNVYCDPCCPPPFVSPSGIALISTPNPSVFTAEACPKTIFFNVNCPGATSYTWKWGDNNTSITPGGASHLYATPGVYNIVVTSSGPSCAPVTMTILLTVNIQFCEECCTGPFVTGPGLQNFSQSGNPMTWFANSCLGVPLSLAANCPNATGFTWNWGDGSPVNIGGSVTHTYLNPGFYVITVTPSGPNCNSVAQTILLTVGLQFCPSCCTTPFVSGTGLQNITPGPNPMIILAGACPGTPLSLVANCASATNYVWNWGDASPNSTGQFATHTYLTPGTYDITILPTGPGCTGLTQTITLTVGNQYCDPCCPGQILNGLNFVDFSPTNNPNIYNATVCKDQNFTLNASFCQAALSYTWNFGVVPVTITNVGTTSYQFASAGIYPVIITTGGDMCSLSQTVYINVIDCNCSGANIIPPGNGCVDYPVSLNVGGCLDPNAIYNWNYGDGNTGTGNPGSHIYTSPGTYNISLTILQPPLPPTIINTSIIITNCTTLNNCKDCIGSFAPTPGEYIVSLWVKEDSGFNTNFTTYSGAGVEISFIGNNTIYGPFYPNVAKNKIIDGWQRIEEKFTVPVGITSIKIKLINNTFPQVLDCYFDDIRIFPVNGNMKSYVYDPVTLRLSAELDENNYATFYEYDEEGKLIRVKKETERGIMTIKESRNNIKKK
jgi:PKD repeat protein